MIAIANPGKRADIFELGIAFARYSQIHSGIPEFIAAADSVL